MNKEPFVRPQAAELAQRLKEPRRFIQVVSGARQVGKTTLALQVADQSKLPYHFASADEPTLRGNGWLESQWEEARLLAASSKRKSALLILDEVQKVPHWAETVKYLWDEDTRKKTVVKNSTARSAPLLIGHGLTESLAGRFEILHMPALELFRNAGSLRMGSEPISFLRSLSRCRTIDRTTTPLVALHHRLSHRNNRRTRRAFAFPR